MNFRESTTILDACTKMSANLLNAPRIYIHIYIDMKVKLATIVEGDPMALFSLATTLRSSGGHYTFPLDYCTYPSSMPYND